MYAVGQEDLPQVPGFIRSQAAKRTTGGLLMGKEEKSTDVVCTRWGHGEESDGVGWEASRCLDFMRERSLGQVALFPRAEGKGHLCGGMRDNSLCHLDSRLCSFGLWAQVVGEGSRQSPYCITAVTTPLVCQPLSTSGVPSPMYSFIHSTNG